MSMLELLLAYMRVMPVGVVCASTCTSRSTSTNDTLGLCAIAAAAAADTVTEKPEIACSYT